MGVPLNRQAIYRTGILDAITNEFALYGHEDRNWRPPPVLDGLLFMCRRILTGIDTRLYEKSTESPWLDHGVHKVFKWIPTFVGNSAFF
ncbi:MAG: hypothetical protein A3F46_08525 [Legionellales bacterium RIFCSPHIGHO2_12_FULL_42_9]|nr:MAG: hypothetical protein A3F46_08525 [Legionellales bacterium RIFCSPHIGHO2_12_FULL_42_9]